MNFLENISVVWQKLSLVQRAMLMAILVAGGITAVFLTKWASKPDMRPLYTNLSPEDASKITDKIAEKGIIFELRSSGNIYVPKEHVYQLRNDCAGAGLPSSDSPGYKLFEDSGITSSPFLNQMNKMRALQDEVAKSIQSFNTISKARVHIVQPEQNPFKESEGNSTASVVLSIRPGARIGQNTVAAITHMVAGSVEGLNSNNVTVVDSHGNLLSNSNDDGISGSASRYMDYKAETEKRLAAEAQEMLEYMLGPGKAKVIVSAEVDMKSEETLTKTLGEKIPIEEQIKTTNKTKAAGTDSKGNPVTPDEEGTEEIITNYTVPETTTKKIKMAGEIISISVSVAVDLSSPAVTANAGEGEETAKPASADNKVTLEDVKKLMLTALGKSKLTEENLTVIDTKFYRPEIPEPVKEPWHIAYIGLVKQGSLGLMAICALFALKIFSGKVKPRKGGGAVAQFGSGENSAGALPAGDMREQIALAYKSDPEQVKELFTSWVEEKG